MKAHAQAQEKEKSVNKLIASNIAIGRMEEKLKVIPLNVDAIAVRMSKELPYNIH